MPSIEDDNVYLDLESVPFRRTKEFFEPVPLDEFIEVPSMRVEGNALKGIQPLPSPILDPFTNCRIHLFFSASVFRHPTQGPTIDPDLGA